MVIDTTATLILWRKFSSNLTWVTVLVEQILHVLWPTITRRVHLDAQRKLGRARLS